MLLLLLSLPYLQFTRLCTLRMLCEELAVHEFVMSGWTRQDIPLLLLLLLVLLLAMAMYGVNFFIEEAGSREQE